MMTPLDLSNPRLVAAGTVYGECRGGGLVGMSNVAGTIITRVRTGWGSSITAVCLAHAQYSCWADLNRQAIEDARVKDPANWLLALQVADQAMAGTLTCTVGDADSYFALSMPHKPYWAVSPASYVTQDKWHAFWNVRHRRAFVPNVSMTTDQLNALQLAKAQEFP